jgi:hypothetical protein
MPRNGDNSADNAIEAGENIVHGATGDVYSPPLLILFDASF